jgi:pimeloyl-ACP methyl ester carboxylesterase
MQKEIILEISGKKLEAFLSLPEKAKGIVLFVHGSGSSRFSPRNQYVAKILQSAHFGTLLIDLLSKEEEVNPQNRFNIPLLAKRVLGIIGWIQKETSLKGLSLSLFGASTGAAAALIAAKELPQAIKAVISRGGRPDLAKEEVEKVYSPTLLIVGELDFEVITLNEWALERLRGPKKFEIVSGATHLFEESGCLEQVAKLAVHWLEKYA